MDQDTDLRVVIMPGTGNRAFCSVLHLKKMIMHNTSTCVLHVTGKNVQVRGDSGLKIKDIEIEGLIWKE